MFEMKRKNCVRVRAPGIRSWVSFMRANTAYKGVRPRGRGGGNGERRGGVRKTKHEQWEKKSQHEFDGGGKGGGNIWVR